jgi:hypothetical protein
MTDRELLEFAAKAAGVEVWFPRMADGNGGVLEPCHTSRNGQTEEWNPLIDDGDALRLFCALPWLCIETSDVAATVRERGNPDEPSRVYFMWTEWLDKHNGDLAAATRRAIVRAYADIGRAER